MWRGIAAAVVAVVVMFGCVLQSGAQEPAATPVPSPAPYSVIPTNEAPTTVSLVTVGVFINDIQEIDLKQGSYQVDFYLWMRWRNPDIDPADTIELINPFERWGTVTEMLFPQPEVMPDGSFYQVIRYQGDFAAKLPLHDYPFDEQELTIELEDQVQSTSTLAYVLDKDPLTVDHEISVPGYVIGTPTIEVVTDPYLTTFGDVRLAAPEPYSRIIVTIPVSRPWKTSIVSTILPILLVVVVAVLVFLLHPKYVEPRVGMAITALLTLVALEFTTAADLPYVEYLIMLDLLYLVSFVYVLVVLASVVATSWLMLKRQDDQALKLDRQLLLITTVAYLVAIVFTMWWFMR